LPVVLGWIALGQSADGLGWIGSHKMDPWTTLVHLNPVKFKAQDYRLKFTVTWWKLLFFGRGCDVVLFVCRVICAKVGGATSSEGCQVDWLINRSNSHYPCACMFSVLLQSESRSDEESDRRSSSSDGRRPSRVSVIISHDK